MDTTATRPIQAQLGWLLLDAVYHDDTAAVSALLAAGANANTKNHVNINTLMVSAIRGYISPANAFLATHDIFLNQLDWVLLDAIHRNNTASILALFNADTHVNITNYEDIAALIGAPIIQGYTSTVNTLVATSHDILMNEVNEESDTALMVATKHGYTATVNALLSAPDIQVNYATPTHGITALMMAAKLGYTEIVNVLLRDPRVLVNQTNQTGETALIMAVLDENLATVNALLSARDIDVSLITHYGETAISIAYQNDNDNTVRLLQARGAILPMHLINRIQSIHEISINVSVSRSAKNLLEQYLYTPEQVTQAINELVTWLNTGLAHPAELPREYKAEWLEPAKRCVERLKALEFIDQRSGITMQQALALIWVGINNPHARGADKPALEPQELIDRSISFVKQLYEIQRGYNLSNSANPIDNGGADEFICAGGSFNKLIGALSDAGHKGVQIIFVNSTMINSQIPFLSAQAFNRLPEEDRKRFAQDWENGNSEALQAECFDLLKEFVTAKLHETYMEYYDLHSIFVGSLQAQRPSQFTKKI